MKRLIIVVLLIIFGFASLGNAEYKASEKVKNRIDSLMVVVEKDWGTKSKVWQLDRYEKIINSFGSVKLQ